MINLFDKVLGAFSTDLAIDLGTANTLVFLKNKGVVVDEPSVVAVKDGEYGNKKVLAVGAEAKKMLGRTPGNIVAVRPMKDGVIADFDVTGEMLRYFIHRVHNRKALVRPRIVICVPSGITQVEKRAVREAAEHAGAREVYLIEEPMAAAIGSGLPITEASGSMIVDIGGGTTDVAVISLAGIVHANSVRVGGDKLDESIINFIKRKYNILIGERTAEAIKIEIGSAYPDEEEVALFEGTSAEAKERQQVEYTVDVKGRDLVSGIPKTVEVSSMDIREAISEPVRQIVEAVKRTLESTPPELAGDIVEKGITLGGGGALLRNLDTLLHNETQLPIHIAENSLTVVARGSGMVLDELDLLKQVSVG